jgi:hypothetical protein
MVARKMMVTQNMFPRVGVPREGPVQGMAPPVLAAPWYPALAPKRALRGIAPVVITLVADNHLVEIKIAKQD